MTERTDLGLTDYSPIISGRASWLRSRFFQGVANHRTPVSIFLQIKKSVFLAKFKTVWYNLDTRETYIKSIDNKFAVNNGFGYAVLRSENHNVKAITQKFIKRYLSGAHFLLCSWTGYIRSEISCPRIATWNTFGHTSKR